MINAIAAEGIPTYGGRTEGSMCAAADGFTRVTGEVAACSGTEGPGFTNMIMNIGAANAARTPLLVLASNMTVGGDDTERGIQRGYQQPTTVGMKKYGKRLITPNRVYEYAAYAFRHLRSGVPRPVHLDFTGEVAFDPDAKVIRIDPDAADIGRNLPVDLGLVASARGGSGGEGPSGRSFLYSLQMRPQDTVLACLQKYADRGIFRGFGVRATRGGSLECRFLWHAPTPHRLRFEPQRSALVFVDLLPGVPYPSAMDRALRSYVAARRGENLPEHRRLDPAKASAGCRNRAGSVSIEVRCLDGDFEYAATRAVKLVNEVFLDFLAGPYDAYMIEHFGAPEE